MNFSGDDDAIWGNQAHYDLSNGGSRYPVHDCCEMRSADELKALIFVPQYSSDEDSDDSSSCSSGEEETRLHSGGVNSGESKDEAVTVTATATATAESSTPNDSKNDISTSNDNNGHSNAGIKDNATKSGNSIPDENKDEGESKNETKGEQLESLNSNSTSLGANSITETTALAVPPENCKQLKQPRYYCPYDVDERDDDENTPLHVAIQSLKYDCVKLLIEAGASVNKRSDGSTPLHLAISLGAIPSNKEFSLSCVKLLLEEGNADLFLRDDSSQTPLLLATKSNNLPVVEYILNHTSDGPSTLEKCDRLGNRPLTAINARTPPALTTLLLTHMGRRYSNAASVSSSGTASTTGNRSLKVLKNYSGRTALHQAMSCGNWDVARILLQHDDVIMAQRQVAMAESKLTTTLTDVPMEDVDVNTNVDPSKHRENQNDIKDNSNSSKNRHRSKAHIHSLERLKYCKDKRGWTALDLSLRRGYAPPMNLISLLTSPPSSSSSQFSPSLPKPTRDMILDPPTKTLIATHDICLKHYTCSPIRRGGEEPPPENVRRLNVLVNKKVGILRSDEFHSSQVTWNNDPPRANIADVLRVHSYPYINKISTLCSALPDHPSCVSNLDPDTAISHHSFESAMYATGAVIEVVDAIMNGDYRNAFLPLRPPGHHAGPDGVVTCNNDPDGSHGFCLINHVAVAAAYFRATYKAKVAIVDFDVHHGNGTQECLMRALMPSTTKRVINLPPPFSATSTFTKASYSPWLNEHDSKAVFFASTHGYGAREDCGFGGGGWFYPASGESFVSSFNATSNTSASFSGKQADLHSEELFQQIKLKEFLQSQSWTTFSEKQRLTACNIINCGLSRCDDYSTNESNNAQQRLDLRESYRTKILPNLMNFNPDLILISAGFDAHKRDGMNQGYIGLVEDDYEWLTHQLIKVSNSCCQGRLISVLEGGYKIHGGIVSPFARSVAAHVRALVDGGCSREMFDAEDNEWESAHERSMMEMKVSKNQELHLSNQRVTTRSSYHNRLQDINSNTNSSSNKDTGTTSDPKPNSNKNDSSTSKKEISDDPNNIDSLFHEPLKDETTTTAAASNSISVGGTNVEVAVKGAVISNVEGQSQEHDDPDSALYADAAANMSMNLSMDSSKDYMNLDAVEDTDEVPSMSRKRRRPQVDYKLLYEQMKKEESVLRSNTSNNSSSRG